MNRNNKGFTLVELIVVLVILAILAALLVPALLGYIERAKKHQNIENARSLMMATQAALVELYAQTGGKVEKNKSIVPGVNSVQQKNGDCDLSKTDFAKKILETADLTGINEPYLYMFAVGSNYNTKPAVTDKDKFTVFYGLYMEKEDSPKIYFYNGDWTEDNPRKKNSSDILDEYNKFVTGPYKDKNIQYYLVINKNTAKKFPNGAFWDWIKEVN